MKMLKKLFCHHEYIYVDKHCITHFPGSDEYIFKFMCKKCQKKFFISSLKIELIKNTQEAAFSYSLSQPLLSLTDKSISDIISLENRMNNLNIYTFTGEEIFINDYQEQKGYYGRFTTVDNARGNIAQKVSCNMLPHANASWSIAKESCCQNANQLHLKFSNLRLGIRDDTPVEQKRIAFSNFIKSLYDDGTPIKFLYILKNPTVEPLEPDLVEKLKTLKTFYPITHIFSNVPLSFDYKMNLENWHKVVSKEVEESREIIYDLKVQQNNLEVMQLETALEMQYNTDLNKLGGNLC